MKRSLVIRYRDGTEKEFPISKATRIKSKGLYDLLHFDKLPDGTWRVTFSDLIAEDFSTIMSFTIHREN